MREVEVFDNPDNLRETIVEQAAELIAGISNPRVAVSGGGLGVQIASSLIRKLHENRQLDSVQFFMADERFVETESEDSNLGQILKEIGNLDPNFYSFPKPSEMAIDQAADRANEELGSEFAFDLAIMGCGPDGHTASLFPGHSYPNRTVVVEKDSPKPPAQRLSFGYSVFEASTNVWFAVSGTEKATAVSQALGGNTDLPAGEIKGKSNKWFITEELA